MTTLNQAVNTFLQYCRYEKNLSEKTIYFYRIDLLQFYAFIETQKYPVNVEQISKTELKHYIREISSWKVRTVKRKVATLKAMFNYLEDEDLILVNPVRRLKMSLKQPVILPKALTKIEAASIFDAAYRLVSKAPRTSYAYFESIRNIAVLELLFSSGARVSEIANLKKTDLNLKSGALLLKGKGNKERVVQVCNPDALALLGTYVSLFDERIKVSGGYLLVNRLNNKLSDQSIRNMIDGIAKVAKVDKKVTPHVFRHTFATLLLENDVDIKYIQSLLGHSSIITTQIYTQVNSEKQKQILRDKHPRMDFSMAI
ncbi:tyrosine-type recombinase/integrase [Pedobacter sp. WC2501]|uniref:tyrosine-type recombinase/integrase n=1 Tax=Pedobacter sp. WC2501 TaxID=3461400 RepID=UPI004045E058